MGPIRFWSLLDLEILKSICNGKITPGISLSKPSNLNFQRAFDSITDVSVLLNSDVDQI